MSNLGIKVENLEKIYSDSVHALKGVSFAISKPGLYGIIGPNGAGKTTLLKLISGLLIPTNGKVFINDQYVKYGSLLPKNTIGFLPENAGLYDKLSARDFLHIMAGLHGLAGEEKRQRVREVVKFVGINFSPGKYVKNLSTGQRRLLLLASVLLHDPPILILDESLNGLDPIHRHEISELMQELSNDKIVLFSSHILADIWRLCERVLVLNDGRLTIDDTPENILLKMSENTYYISISKNVEKALKILEKQNEITNIQKSGDKILFTATSLKAANQAIDSLLEEIEVLAFGPNVADLDELFRRMVKGFGS